MSGKAPNWMSWRRFENPAHLWMEELGTALSRDLCICKRVSW